MIDVPDAVRSKALAAGAEDWLEQLPVLVSSLEAGWSIVVGRPYTGGSEAFVAEATRADGTPAVLKVLVPATGNRPSNEATALRLAGGHGCPALYQYDAGRGARAPRGGLTRSRAAASRRRDDDFRAARTSNRLDRQGRRKDSDDGQKRGGRRSQATAIRGGRTAQD